VLLEGGQCFFARAVAVLLDAIGRLLELGAVPAENDRDDSVKVSNWFSLAAINETLTAAKGSCRHPHSG
jgi:hypothetical protein